MRLGTELIAEHYQKTYELTLALWEQRNRTFLILLTVIGVATLFTFKVPEAETLLADFIANILNISDPARLQKLHASFPYSLIQSILLMVVLYLILILYHRTTFILRNYQYLEKLETEIRRGLELGGEDVSFSREGLFYQAHRPKFSRLVGVAYIGMLGILLGAFLLSRIWNDFATGNYWFGLIDSALACLILVFFIAYAMASISIKKLKDFLRFRLKHTGPEEPLAPAVIPEKDL